MENHLTARPKKSAIVPKNSIAVVKKVIQNTETKYIFSNNGAKK
tara:strand:+ start:5456 stop:5587 length:132 start_codon:yes stop_codon:yes gene_type:complete